MNAILPPDASLAECERVIDKVDVALRALGPETIESTFATPGFYYDFNYQPHVNVHYGQIFVTLARERKLGTKEIMDVIRRRLATEDLGRAEIEVAELNDGPPVGRPVTVRLQADELAL